ncbi:hypothetical protein SKAU_G00084770 [Synaphobranchus kaupii]|uniref:Uncharacterized protein n=1 Tax=Synaphobranchus kaupii TaxID=118154 RepID=A0A9Q1J5J7_SYNKA|nr:hypothetical protein SKAU_G00084770 [Synaphobranchus kaupii]
MKEMGWYPDSPLLVKEVPRGKELLTDSTASLDRRDGLMEGHPTEELWDKVKWILERAGMNWTPYRRHYHSIPIAFNTSNSDWMPERLVFCSMAGNRLEGGHPSTPCSAASAHPITFSIHFPECTSSTKRIDLYTTFPSL